MNREEIYTKAISKWGIEPQLDQTVEEMAELTQAISKIKRLKVNQSELIRNNKDVKVHSVLLKALNELCDVELMIGQVKHILTDVCGLNEEYKQIYDNLNNRMVNKLKE